MHIRSLRRVVAAALVLSATAIVSSSTSASAAAPVIYRPFSYGLNPSGVPDMFAHSNDATICYRYPTSTTTWSDWTSLGALPGGVVEDAERIGVGNNNLGNLEVYVVGSDGFVYHDYATSGSGTTWSSWSSLSAPVSPIVGDVAIGTNYLGNQEMYVRTADGSVYHRFATPGVGPGWSNWDTMGKPAVGVHGDVHVGRNYLNNQELYIIGNDGRLYHNFATPGRGSGWQGWDLMDSLPGGLTFTSDVNVGINYVGNQELYAVGSDGAVWHNYATPGQGTGWSSFGSLGGPGVGIQPTVDVEPYDFRVLQSQYITVYNSTGVPRFDDQTPGVGSGWGGWVAT